MGALRLRKDAYTVQALVDAGVPAARAKTLMVADNAPLARPRVSVTGRKRVARETRDYAWGPDVLVLLAEDAR